MKASPCRITATALVLFLAAWLSRAQQILPPQSASANAPDKSSKARVALLSEVKGDVALSAGVGFRKAFAHSPIPEHSRLQTGVGRAEVEFEDSSTLRLAPYSQIEFSRLELLPSGIRASTIRVLKGTAYVSVTPSYVVNNKGDDFLLVFGEETLHLRPSNHIRLELKETEARLSVLDGKGQIEGPFGTADLLRKRTFTFDLQSESAPAIERKIHSTPFDNWDRWAAEYHKRTAGLGNTAGNSVKGPRKRRHDIF